MKYFEHKLNKNIFYIYIFIYIYYLNIRYKYISLTYLYTNYSLSIKQSKNVRTMESKLNPSFFKLFNLNFWLLKKKK